MKRTRPQQNAIEVYCREVASQLNDKGVDLKALLSKKAIPVSCTQENVKDNIWKPIQLALFGKISSTDLETTEVNTTFEQMNRWLGQEWGIHVPFPSEDE